MEKVKWVGEKVTLFSNDGEGNIGKSEETVLRMDGIGLTTKDEKGFYFYPWFYVVLMVKGKVSK